MQQLQGKPVCPNYWGGGVLLTHRPDSAADLSIVDSAADDEPDITHVLGQEDIIVVVQEGHDGSAQHCSLRAHADGRHAHNAGRMIRSTIVAVRQHTDLLVSVS
jgi:hypothetical protein